MYLFGASGHGKVVKDILQTNGVQVEAFVDDNCNIKEISSCYVLHDATGLSPIIVSIGMCRIRKKIVERLEFLAKSTHNKLEFGMAIHSRTIVSESVKIGEGTVVMAGVVINSDVVIGKHCIINTGATIDHDCIIEDYCHIAPGAHICGSTHIGECTWVGVGSCVIQEINIGRNCMVGAGSVVVKDIPDNVVAYGNPCKTIRSNE